MTGVLIFLTVLSGNLYAAPQQPPPQSKDNQNSARLWAENCGNCHNLRSPSGYSDAQWEVATMHMRIRANLTAEETRKILDFLKQTN